MATYRVASNDDLAGKLGGQQQNAVAGALNGTITDFPYDMNFVTDTYKGGFQTYGNNNNDGRFFRDSGNFQARYAPNAAGLLVLQSAAGMQRTDKGACMFGPVTFVGLWNRDLTNVAWVSGGGGITAVKDQTGADGSANAATRITATGAAGTHIQSITSASATRVFFCYVKRLVGVGTLEMTVDGGTTWTVVTTTASYIQVFCTLPAITNPMIGFRIATSGDSFAIDFASCHGTLSGEALPVGTPVAYTSSAFGALAHSVPWALTTDAGPLSSIMKGGFAFFWQGRSQRIVGECPFVSDGVTNCNNAATNKVNFVATVTLATPDNQWLANSALNKVAGYMTAAGAMRLCVNGNTPVSRTGGSLSPSLTHFVLGSNGSGGSALNGFVERFAIGANLTFTDAALQAMTT